MILELNEDGLLANSVAILQGILFESEPAEIRIWEVDPINASDLTEMLTVLVSHKRQGGFQNVYRLVKQKEIPTNDT